MLVENRGAVASVHCLLGTTYLTVHFILEAVWVWAVRKVRLGCLCHPPSPSHDSGSPDSKPSVHSFTAHSASQVWDKQILKIACLYTGSQHLCSGLNVYVQNSHREASPSVRLLGGDEVMSVELPWWH